MSRVSKIRHLYREGCALAGNNDSFSDQAPYSEAVFKNKYIKMTKKKRKADKPRNESTPTAKRRRTGRRTNRSKTKKEIIEPIEKLRTQQSSHQ